jgi:hypothetical protein
LMPTRWAAVIQAFMIMRSESISRPSMSNIAAFINFNTQKW